jgi:CheY-like chemotaxis protein
VHPPLDHRAYPVLVVDDEPDILEIVGLNYEREFTLHTALGGTEALDLVRQHDVAVLIADRRMPGMTGLEVISGARQIRPKTSFIGRGDAVEGLIERIACCLAEHDVRAGERT